MNPLFPSFPTWGAKGDINGDPQIGACLILSERDVGGLFKFLLFCASAEPPVSFETFGDCRGRADCYGGWHWDSEDPSPLASNPFRIFLSPGVHVLEGPSFHLLEVPLQVAYHRTPSKRCWH